MHFDGFYTSIYFARFPASYLRTLRDVNIDLLRSQSKIKMHHTRRYNLLHTTDRTEFIKDFIALVRFIALGEANIGFLGRNSQDIHRGERDMEEQVVHCPQVDAEEKEEVLWRMSHADQYTN